MVAGWIPWDSMVAWCDFHALDYEAARILIRVIRQLDIDRAEREESDRQLAELQRKRGAA